MNRSESSSSKADQPQSSASRTKFGKKTVGGIAVLVLLGAYSVAQPILNSRLGWNLPALRQDSSGQIVADDGTAAANARTTSPTQEPQSGSELARDQPSSSTASQPQQANDLPTRPRTTNQPTAKSSRGPLADQVRRDTATKANATRGSPQPGNELRYGLLRDIGGERYISPAGLQYGRGSQEGHRLEHLRRHTQDIPDRKGSHGVFDGEMEGALKTIDLAYQRAKQGQRTTKQTDQDRTIYTVDLGKRIGFIGGETGQRKRHPMARRVRLVLEGNNFITAYPL